MSKIKEMIEKYEQQFEKNISDDIGVNNSVSTLFEFIKEIKKFELNEDEKLEVKNFVKKIDKVLGCDFFKNDKVEIPNEIYDLAKKRVEFKKNKDWEKADEIREEVKNLGFKIIDSNDTFKIEKL